MLQVIGGKGGLEIDIEHRFETLHWTNRKENQRARSNDVWLEFLLNKDPTRTTQSGREMGRGLLGTVFDIVDGRVPWAQSRI